MAVDTTIKFDVEKGILDAFLDMSTDEFKKWIQTSYLNYVNSGIDTAAAKSKLEEDALYWIEENEGSIEIEHTIMRFISELSS
ncbi:hypothetical protein [Planococcus lenghuensis]|uniref:Phage protein n=1 Tax=Planococcus lenghuensis TaxID=2213202 RepID=A0A1Q2L0Z9_9BACL|nr:hypothetical protein [Planococcus lenghuensis]AQQ54093.1 hypothetical protein B0X71_13930 [Planococcus lenghuensis]